MHEFGEDSSESVYSLIHSFNKYSLCTSDMEDPIWSTAEKTELKLDENPTPIEFIFCCEMWLLKMGKV